MSEAMIAVLDDAGLRETLRRGARDVVREHYDWERATGRIIAALRSTT
jgi:glycosyltransferase involved in cell wall biosynthesis